MHEQRPGALDFSPLSANGQTKTKKRANKPPDLGRASIYVMFKGNCMEGDMTDQDNLGGLQTLASTRDLEREVVKQVTSTRERRSKTL